MRPLSKKHARILGDLTTGLDDEGHRRIDNTGGVFMPVVVEQIGSNRFSVAHYYEQNGDLVPDPDLEFVTNDGAWFPAAVTHCSGHRRVLTTDADGRITRWSPSEYADLRRLACLLLSNIKAQQGQLKP